MFAFDSKMATVRPWLLLGAAPHEHDYSLLRNAGVTHILQVGSELRPTFPDRFKYGRVALDDAEQEDIIRHLPRCFKFIDDARLPTTGSAAHLGCTDFTDLEGAVASCCCGGGAAHHAVRPPAAAAAGGSVVLVHCAAGVSRSATVVISYLMASELLPYESAFREVKTARPCIYPNLGFLLQLWEWEAGGRDCQRWPGWNKERFAERLSEYRRAQTAAGLHPAVRVRLPLAAPGAANGISRADAAGARPLAEGTIVGPSAFVALGPVGPLMLAVPRVAGLEARA